MKKTIILSLLVAVSSLHMTAQTYYGSKILLNANDSGVDFDLDDPDLFNGFVLKILDANNNVIIDLGNELQNNIMTGNGTFHIPSSSFGTEYTATTNYSFTYNSDYYKIEYYLPSTWQFNYYCHNPYTSFGVNVYLYDISDTYMGYVHIGEASYSHELMGTYWHCYGSDWGTYSPWSGVKIKESTIYPYWTHEDMYYDYYSYFKSQIDHCKISISFRVF